MVSSLADSGCGFQGKTLSLLCSTLTWLADDQERRVKGELDSLKEQMQGSGGEWPCTFPSIKLIPVPDPPWVLTQSLDRHRRSLLAADEELARRLENARRQENDVRREAAKRAVGGAGRVVKRQVSAWCSNVACRVQDCCRRRRLAFAWG